MTTQDERIQILKMIEDGTITPSQGLELFKALGEGFEDELEAAPEQDEIVNMVSPSESFAPPVPLASQLEEPYPPASPLPPAEPVSPVETVRSTEPVPPVWNEPAGGENLPPEPERAQPVTGDVLPEVPPAPDFSKWQRWWQIPLWIGVIITVLGGVWMYLAYQASGLGFWFACAWFPFLFGVGVLALAWASRSMRWLHLRVHQKPGERPQTIAISMPLPLGLGAWFFRTFGNRISGLKGQNIDQAMLMLEHTSPDAPLYIKVDDEDGEHVEIFIG